MEYEGARFERRFFAWVIDKGISLLFFALYFFLFFAFASKEISILFYGMVSSILAYITYLLLFVPFMNRCGSSIGMWIFRIKAVHFTDGEISFKEALIRAILSGLFAFAIANSVYMLMAHTERSAIDQLTETYIVRR